MIEIERANIRNVGELIGRIRESDTKEIKASTGLEADTALVLSYERSTQCWVLRFNKLPTICFGVAPNVLDEKVGVPWLLATDDIARIKLPVLKRTKYYLDRMQQEYSALENWVDVRNKLSIKWLEWCGFNFDDPKPFGFENKLFRRFWWRKEGA